MRTLQRKTKKKGAKLAPAKTFRIQIALGQDAAKGLETYQPSHKTEHKKQS